MNNYEDKMNTEGALTGEIVDNNKLVIFVTEEDKTGNDITAMSNFFDNYLSFATANINQTNLTEVLDFIPIADLSIISEVLSGANALLIDDYSFVVDFDHLPDTIKEKLKKGIYKLGESRQVDGNLRAVIVDETGTRVKDVTLKKVINNPQTSSFVRSISNQIQMKQLAAKLNSIQALQNYQIERDRDRDLIVPFLNARDYVLQSQNQETKEEEKRYLNKASEELTSVINSTYRDIVTSSESLAKEIRRPIFQINKNIEKFMNYLSRDLQLVTRYVGVQMQILEYLGDANTARQVSDRYCRVLEDFANKGIGRQQVSPADMLQMYFPYDETNLDSWLKLKEELVEISERRRLAQNNNVVLLSVED